MGSSPTARAKIKQTKLIAMSKFGNYVQEAYDELIHKVTWPTWNELQKTSLVVLLGLIIISLVIWGMDVISKYLMEFINSFAG